MHNKSPRTYLTLSLVLMFTLLLAAACSSAPTAEEPATADEMTEMDENSDHDEGASHEGDDHDDSNLGHIPNNGAVIRIVSPSDGATFAAGDEILVEVETEDFALGEEGNHWHVYIDGSSWGMVMGSNHDQVLRGLEPGEHEISVFMSVETHEQLEDGDSVTITVEE